MVVISRSGLNSLLNGPALTSQDTCRLINKPFFRNMSPELANDCSLRYIGCLLCFYDVVLTVAPCWAVLL